MSPAVEVEKTVICLDKNTKFNFKAQTVKNIYLGVNTTSAGLNGRALVLHEEGPSLDPCHLQ